MFICGDDSVHIHLRRAGLAADAVALDVGVATAAVGDDVLQKLPHRIRGLLGDGLAAHHGLPPLDDLAIFGNDLLHDCLLYTSAPAPMPVSWEVTSESALPLSCAL